MASSGLFILNFFEGLYIIPNIIKLTVMGTILIFMLLSYISHSAVLFNEVQNLTEPTGTIVDIDLSADNDVLTSADYGNYLRIYRRNGLLFSHSQSF